MLLYDHIFHREMCSMTCQTGRPLPDWIKMCDVMYFMLFFLEVIVKINFNNYLLLYEIELVHIFFFTSTNKHIIGYEPAGLTVHPPPRMIEGGFIFFVWVSSVTKIFSSKKSGFCRRYSHWNAPKRGFTS